jgi:hypothetical protein
MQLHQADGRAGVIGGNDLIGVYQAAEDIASVLHISRVQLQWIKSVGIGSTLFDQFYRGVSCVRPGYDILRVLVGNQVLVEPLVTALDKGRLLFPIFGEKSSTLMG